MTHRIIPRHESGLRPPRVTIPPMPLPASEVWIHHTVTRVTGDPLADWREVQAVGFGRGFHDISYSYGVHPGLGGEVLEGRGLLLGAHTAGRNARSFGVVLVGNYEEREMTPAMVDNVRWLIDHLQDLGHLRRGSDYPNGGHRDLSPTACPGRHAHALLGQMRVDWTDETPLPPPPPAGPPVGPSVPAWPGRYLRLPANQRPPWMRGDDVRQVQQRLADRGWRIDVDGIFGPGTNHVVRAFQAEKRLGVDGIVGPATWRALWTAPVT